MASVNTYVTGDGKKKNAVIKTTNTGARLDGTGTITNYEDGKFATLITPTTKTYLTGAKLDGTGTVQNNGNGKFAAEIDTSAPKTSSNGLFTATLLDGTPSATGGSGSSSGSAATYQATPVADPYSSLYSIYENQLNAQRDALNQQRAARQNALQANYNNAKSQLDSSFNQGETEMNQSADKALREAYINNMLNQKALNQQLASQGITGGALESILARSYNNYGNSRNEIENNRMNQLRQLLANYQGTLGDIENSYLSGMADADSDYSGSIADALSSYYNNLASLQQQNIANQYKTALGKSGSSSSSSTTSADEKAAETKRKNLVSTIKNFKDDPEGLMTVADAYGIDYTTPDGQLLLLDAGINPNILNTSSSTNYAKSLATVPADVKNKLLSYLDQSRGQVYGDDARLIAALQTFGRQNGLSEEQVKAILAEAGY